MILSRDRKARVCSVAEFDRNFTAIQFAICLEMAIDASENHLEIKGKVFC
jgi:hypothetical protein